MMSNDERDRMYERVFGMKGVQQDFVQAQQEAAAGQLRQLGPAAMAARQHTPLLRGRHEGTISLERAWLMAFKQAGKGSAYAHRVAQRESANSAIRLFNEALVEHNPRRKRELSKAAVAAIRDGRTS